MVRKAVSRCDVDASESQAAQQDALRRVQEVCPARETEAAELWEHVSRGTGGRLVFVHGGPGTGKTRVVRSVLEISKQPNAYLNAVETSKERHVLQLILEQLRGPKKRELVPEGGVMYFDFVVEIAGMFPWGGARTAWVVLDNVDRLDASLLAPLLRLAHHASAAISWVLISRQLPTPGTPFTEGLHPDLSTRLTMLHFPPYTLPQLTQVMRGWQPGGSLEAQKLLEAEAVSLVRVSRSPEDMQQAMVDLHARLAYTAAAAAPGRMPSAALPARGAAGNARRRNWEPNGQEARARRNTTGAFATGLAPDPRQESDVEAYELPTLAKVLVVAAYVAARTRETMDRATFDPTARRKRRKQNLAHDKQTEEARLEELKGRRTFGRERLLAIFWSLLDAHLLQMDDGTNAQPPPSALPATPREQQSAAVLGHLAGLVAVRALLQVQENGLQATKYTCDLPDVLVQQIANELSLDLRTYVQ